MHLGKFEEDSGDDSDQRQKRIPGWLGKFKEALKDERKQRWTESSWEEGDEDDGDEDEGDEVMARLRHLADNVEEKGESADIEAVTSCRKRKPAASPTESKRLRTAAGLDGVTRAMPSPLARATTAALHDAGVGLKVREQDVVQVLHRSGKITLKQLIDHFKGYLKSKEDKAAFRKLVSAVSKLDKDGDTCYAILKDTVLYKYHCDLK